MVTTSKFLITSKMKTSKTFNYPILTKSFVVHPWGHSTKVGPLWPSISSSIAKLKLLALPALKEKAPLALLLPPFYAPLCNSSNGHHAQFGSSATSASPASKPSIILPKTTSSFLKWVASSSGTLNSPHISLLSYALNKIISIATTVLRIIIKQKQISLNIKLARIFVFTIETTRPQLWSEI